MIHGEIVDRYDRMLVKLTDDLEQRDNLRWMLFTIRDGYAGEKSYRWLGFVQDVMISRGITTVQAERDFARP